MTKTWSAVCRSASLSILLVSGCTSGSSDTNSGASGTDAGSRTDASTSETPQTNELADAAVHRDAGDAAADSGSHRAADSGAGRAGRPAAGGTGGHPAAGASGAAREDEPDEPAAGSGGASGSAGDARAAAGSSGTGANVDDADAGTDPNAICTSCGACEQTVPVVSTMHTNMPVNYPDPPPTSGPHNPCWAAWGIHDEPLAPERWVHNMEHGGVVFVYNCPDGCSAEVATLAKIASARSRTVLAAYDKLPARFAVVSWGHRLVSECLDEQAFVAFYNAHFDRAPESNANPPNPSCPP